MMGKPKSVPTIRVPKSWPACVQSAMLHVVSLAQYAIVHTRSWAADSPNARVRLNVENDQLQQDNALLREEMRIKDVRMACIPPHRRPYYPQTERMDILEVRAARCWSLQQTADAFFVTAATVASWMNRLDEAEPDGLVRLRTPVNKFPEFVRYAVQRLKTLCPTMGKKKLAQVLVLVVAFRIAAMLAILLVAGVGPRPPFAEDHGVRNILESAYIRRNPGVSRTRDPRCRERTEISDQRQRQPILALEGL